MALRHQTCDKKANGGNAGGEQRLGGKHDREQWIWLRARWLARSGVIERSDIVAMKAKRGLWAEVIAVKPWDWRKGVRKL